MIAELLPDTVATVEDFGHDDTGHTPLHPEEEPLVARAVAKRRREFTVVRSCARRAMLRLGVPAQPVLTGERGAPLWPKGLLGSMTHCDGYCAAALVRDTDLASVGIDAEPAAALPDGVLDAVALPSERDRLRRLAEERPHVPWDRLLFSAKESVYKAWFPLTGAWLDFDEADIEFTTGPDRVDRGALRASLLVPGPRVGRDRLGRFDGRWTVRDGLLATVVVVPRP
ncbi:MULTISPECIES: 4'-phosphopantetheinyl transferase family protein [unclassified Streptomyces]|uniref:4'-phosphopantetheinyl transferase family protein n=1 Tax=unclassified Streptomyces TaxID=2593676 RepID=UPI0019086DE9|nr:4'-phosphopantetheinyl transferase superfamily protein [Streptomyces sp. HSG2]